MFDFTREIKPLTLCFSYFSGIFGRSCFEHDFANELPSDYYVLGFKFT